MTVRILHLYAALTVIILIEGFITLFLKEIRADLIMIIIIISAAVLELYLVHSSLSL